LESVRSSEVGLLLAYLYEREKRDIREHTISSVAVGLLIYSEGTRVGWLGGRGVTFLFRKKKPGPYVKKLTYRTSVSEGS
jgi:hypothetical protein